MCTMYENLAGTAPRCLCPCLTHFCYITDTCNDDQIKTRELNCKGLVTPFLSGEAIIHFFALLVLLAPALLRFRYVQNLT